MSQCLHLLPTEERDNRRNLKYVEDKAMWAAIQSLIDKTTDNGNPGKENNGNPGKSEDCKKEIRKIVQLRKSGASVNSALMLHRAIHHRCNSRVVSVLLHSVGAHVNKKDAKGCTPLHWAAFANPDLTPFLINEGADRTIKNSYGETALSICEKKWSDFVDGIRQDRIFLPSSYSEQHLKNIKSLMPSSQKNLLKEGWMSPRMRHMLLHYAEVAGDAFLDGIGNLSYIPSRLLGQMRKDSFIEGYTECFEVAAHMLRSGTVPTVERIEANLTSTALKQYIEMGGRVEYALDFMLKSIIDDDDAPWHTEGDDEDLEFEALPKTPLDDVVEVAKVMCIDLGGGELDKDEGGPYASRYQEDL